MGFADELLIAVLENVFGNDHDVVNMNVRAVAKAYQFVDKYHGALISQSWLHNQSVDHETIYLNGSQSVALGKLAAGMAFQTYYPISPASDESVFLEAQDPVPLRNGSHAAPVVLQVEDELAAATMACGASLTGARSATSTSGPGFSLMTESIGWAGMNEVPLVVSLYQRAGPSTGMPTRTEQGDLQFVIHAGHGEFPRLVFASGDVEDCFYDTLQAFNYAERYQLPVIHLLDKALASSSQTLCHFQYEDIQIDRGERMNNAAHTTPVDRFKQTLSGISPRPLLGQHNAQHWLSGAEHDVYGQVCEDPVVREEMMEKRMRKQEQILDDLSREEKLRIYGNEMSRFTILTWGSTKGAVWDAVDRMIQQDIEVRAIQLRLLWPFPTAELVDLLADALPLVVVECNYSGQLNALLREHLGRGADHLLIKYSGRPMSGDALFAALQEIHAGNGAPRNVLQNPNE
jgi:2-oxoglutarate ferredoxin oxidoreductase subunit alpha